MHATRCAAHSSLARQTPGGLVFRRDMYLDIPLMADIIAISNVRQQIIDQRLLKANSKRKPHEFTVGEQVLKRNLIGPRDKLRPTFSGPYRILQVHTNGSVTIQLDARIRERINIRRLQPFRRAPLPGAGRMNHAHELSDSLFKLFIHFQLIKYPIATQADRSLPRYTI